VGRDPGYVYKKEVVTISPVHTTSLTAASPPHPWLTYCPAVNHTRYERMLQQRLLQYAIGTPDGEIIEVVKISYCDNVHLLNNKKDIAQLYSTVIESSHYHRNTSTRKNKDYQRSNLRGTKGTMKENILTFFSTSNEYEKIES